MVISNICIFLFSGLYVLNATAVENNNNFLSYVDKANSFTVNYPKGWIVSPNSQTASIQMVDFMSSSDNSDPSYEYFTIVTQAGAEIINADDWKTFQNPIIKSIKSKRPDAKVEVEDCIFANYKGVKLTITSAGHRMYEYVTVAQNRGYFLIIYAKDAVRLKVIESFKINNSTNGNIKKDRAENRQELKEKAGQIFSWINKLKKKDVRGVLIDKFYTSLCGWAALQTDFSMQSGLSSEEIETAALSSAPKLFPCAELGIDENMVGILTILDNLVSDNSLDIHATLEDVWTALCALNLWALKKDPKNKKNINEYFGTLGRRIGGATVYLKDKIDLSEKHVQISIGNMINSDGGDFSKNKLFLIKLNNCYLLGLDVEQLKKKYAINK